MKGFSIVVAMDRERGIGRENRIPWHLPSDLRHFKDITTALYGRTGTNVVIMGRKTWESLPTAFRPLPGRINVVLTSQFNYELPSGVVRCPDFDQAIDAFCNPVGGVYGEVFVIGGAAVYAYAIKHSRCNRIYVTCIDKVFGCDTFFPDIPEIFKECGRSEEKNEKEIRFSFIDYSL